MTRPPMPLYHGLTGRERVILEMIAAGHSNAEIALTIGSTESSINSYVGGLLRKLGWKSWRMIAAQVALRHVRGLETGIPDAPQPPAPR